VVRCFKFNITQLRVYVLRLFVADEFECDLTGCFNVAEFSANISDTVDAITFEPRVSQLPAHDVVVRRLPVVGADGRRVVADESLPDAADTSAALGTAGLFHRDVVGRHPAIVVFGRRPALAGCVGARSVLVRDGLPAAGRRRLSPEPPDDPRRPGLIARDSLGLRVEVRHPFGTTVADRLTTSPSHQRHRCSG